MNIQNEIEKIIDDYFKENHSELIITERIKSGISSVILTNQKVFDVTPDILKREVSLFLDKDKVVDFVKDRQPLVTSVDEKVLKNIQDYFSEHLPRYSVIGVARKSNHPNDHYLYCVIAQNGNSDYACWTSWNESVQSLNYGHYGLTSMKEAMDVLRENFNDITNEISKYGIECSFISVEPIAPKQNENRDIKLSSHRR